MIEPLEVKPLDINNWAYRTAISFNALLGHYFPAQVQTATNITLEGIDEYCGVTDTSSPRTITLPTEQHEGQVFIIKDQSGAAAVNNITIAAGGSETIDGAASQIINTNYGSLRVICDGSGAWFII